MHTLHQCCEQNNLKNKLGSELYVCVWLLHPCMRKFPFENLVVTSKSMKVTAINVRLCCEHDNWKIKQDIDFHFSVWLHLGIENFI